MKQFGDLSELNSVSLRKDTYEIDIVTSSGTYTATVTLTLPPVLAGSDTLVAAASTQSLTNKNLKSGTNLLTGAKADSLQTETGNFTITFPAGAARTLASLDGTETLTNKNLKSGTNLLTGAKADSFQTETGNFTITLPAGAARTLASLDGTEVLTNKDLKSGTNLLTGAKADSFQTETGNFTITLPAGAARTLASLDGSETLTNKILGASKIVSTTEITDASDATKQLAFDLSGMTASKTLTLASAATDNRTITFPNETGTLVTQASTYTPTGDVTLTDSKFFIADNGDSSKKIAFEASSISAATTRTLTAPDASGILTLTTATQSLTNKTLDSSNTITARDDRFSIVAAGDVTKIAAFQCSSITAGNTRTYTLPDASGTVTLLTATQTLTNKSLVVDSTSLVDQSDPTKILKFVASGITAGNTRSITIPDASGTMTLIAATQSLTNKNLKSATNLLTGAAADSFVTETGGHILTLPAGAARTLASLDGSETLTNKNLKSGTNLLTGAKADSFQTETGNFTITLPAGAARTLASLTGTETLSAKTLVTPVIDDYSDINEESAPSSPTAGKVRLYAKTDKRLYQKDSDGVETALAPVSSVSAIGTIDTGTPAANGAQVSGSNLILQSASATVPGLVNLTTQTFAGVKTFTSTPVLKGLAAGASPSSGNIGETLAFSRTSDFSQSTPTLGTWYDITSASLTLTAGNWLLIAEADMNITSNDSVTTRLTCGEFAIRENTTTIYKGLGTPIAFGNGTIGTALDSLRTGYGRAALTFFVSLSSAPANPYKLSIRAVNVSGNPGVLDVTAAATSENPIIFRAIRIS